MKYDEDYTGVELTEGMSVDEFKIYCEHHDSNIETHWDYKKFKIVCQGCGSDDVKVIDDIYFNEGSGCPTCGYSSYTDGRIILKCLKCGKAMQIIDVWLGVCKEEHKQFDKFNKHFFNLEEIEQNGS